MEDFVREARMVMLGFYVKDVRIKHRANQIIQNKTAHTLNQLGSVMSTNEVQARTIDAYYEMGTRYFKRYAAMNWKIFLTQSSRQRYQNLLNEMSAIDRLIKQSQAQAQLNNRKFLLELGQYLMMKVRLEKAVDTIEGEMLNMIEGPYFKDRILPDVVRAFYEAYQQRQQAVSNNT